YVAGNVSSPDFPGFDGIPAQCVPSFYFTRLDEDGTVISSTSLSDASGPVFRDAADRFLVASPPYGIARVDLSIPPDRIACVRDSADLGPVAQVVPGELLSVFGADLGDGYGTLPFSNGALPTSIAGLQIDFDGVLAPLLYVSRNQINLQAPYGIAGKTSVK